MNPTTMLALAALNTPAEGNTVADQRRDRHDRQIAKHDRRNAGQHFQHRLHDFAHRVRGVLAQIDRRHQTDRQRDDGRPGRHQQRAAQQRQDAKVLRPNSGDHFVPVRNSTIETSRKNCAASTTSTTTMPTVVRIETKAQAEKRRRESPAHPNEPVVDRADGRPALPRIDPCRVRTHAENSATQLLCNSTSDWKSAARAIPALQRPAHLRTSVCFLVINFVRQRHIADLLHQLARPLSR